MDNKTLMAIEIWWEKRGLSETPRLIGPRRRDPAWWPGATCVPVPAPPPPPPPPTTWHRPKCA